MVIFLSESVSESGIEKTVKAFNLSVISVSHVAGDANGDGLCSISDAVMLEKWLLGASELSCWENVDLCKDNVIDVFDLIMLRRMVIKQ